MFFYLRDVKSIVCILLSLAGLALTAKAQYSDHRDWNLDSLENIVTGWTPEKLAGAPFETKAAVGHAYSDLMFGYERINPQRALYSARRSFAICDALGSLYRPYLAAKFLGMFHYQHEQYDSTLYYYGIALSYLDRMAAGEAGPDKPEGYPLETVDDARSSLYGNMGNLYYALDSLQLALDYFAKAGEVFEQYGWKESSAVLWYNMGEISLEAEDYASAREYYGKSLAYGQEAGDSLWIATPKLGLGTVYMKQGKTAKALEYLQDADKYFSKHQDQEYTDRIATLDVMGQALKAQKRQMQVLLAAGVLLILLLAVIVVALLRGRRLRRERAAADDVIGEAISELIPASIEESVAKEEQSLEGPAKKMRFVIEEDESSFLSDREKDIIPLIAQGLTSAQIADKLFLSLPTIKWYRRRLLMKFDAKNTAEMLSKAREQGLL